LGFLLTSVYGPTVEEDKSIFLDELKAFKPATSCPWLVSGDFNLIYEAKDKNNLNLNRQLMGSFRHTLDCCELFEFSLQNRRFTWSNEREQPTLVRLDRVFCIKEWDLLFSGFTLQALSSSFFDHCPVYLCQQPKPKIRDSFWFESFWPRVPRFKDVVKEAWQAAVPGVSPLNILFYKMQNMAHVHRNWSKKLFGSARIELHMANEVIHRLDMAQDRRPLTTAEFQLRKDLKVRVLGLAAVERSRRRQASRLIWLREGDACTKFFYLRANGRCRKNHIACLKTEDGTYKWSHEDKEQVLYSYFQSILGSKESRQATFNWANLNLPQLPEQHRLDEPFTEQEVLMAIDQLPAEKAPGPDGFNGIFYKTCWDIIKPDLIAAFQCLYNQTTGPLPKLNGALLTLLSKKEAVVLPGEFKPISLIHSFVKLVSKVLAFWLSTHIDALVSNAQSAFIKRRCIQDNFLYVRNLARAYHWKRLPALLLKLDISKAFDSVSWEYLLELLQYHGFPARW
jgi:endonuclease/exonuclease/phosphatase family metal-dependent hydrolase